jgi:hypothetical protein
MTVVKSSFFRNTKTILVRPGPREQFKCLCRSAAELQAKNEEWQLVCANVFGLQWSQ